MKSVRKNTLSSMLVALAVTAVTAAPVMAQEAASAAPGATADAERGRSHGRGRGHGRGPHGPGAGHGRFSVEAMEHRLERLTLELSLDEHQVVLVREIFTAARDEASAVRDLPRGEARRDARRAFMESVATRIDAILTDAQRETFARLRAEHRERRDERRERREERRARRAAPAGI